MAMPPIEAPVSARCLDPLPTAISICSPDGAIIARFPSGWQREQGFASRCPPVGTDFARTLVIGCRIRGLGSTIREICDADQKTRYEPSDGTQRRFRMAHLARRYTQDLAVAADDGDRRRRHRRRNLFARADRSLERVTGAGDKLYRAMARRRCAALPPPWLSRRPGGKSSLRVSQ